MLENGHVYEYSIPDNGGPAQLTHNSSKARRDFGREQGYSVSLGCIGYYERHAMRMTVRGDYRIHVGTLAATSRAEVDEQIVRNQPFSDSEKARLRHAAKATEDAVARNKKFVPVEATWGL